MLFSSSLLLIMNVDLRANKSYDRTIDNHLDVVVEWHSFCFPTVLYSSITYYLLLLSCWTSRVRAPCRCVVDGAVACLVVSGVRSVGLHTTGRVRVNYERWSFHPPRNNKRPKAATPIGTFHTHTHYIFASKDGT